VKVGNEFACYVAEHRFMSLFKPTQVPPVLATPPQEVPTYTLRKENFWQSKYTILDAAGNIEFEVRRQQKTFQLFTPGSGGASYVYRPKNLWGREHVLVDAPVDFTIATFKDLSVFEPTGVEIGKIVPEPSASPTNFKQTLDRHFNSNFLAAGMKKHFVMGDQTVCRFGYDFKTGAMCIFVIRPQARYFSKALAFAVLFRLICLSQGR
jgi:hypothetical protein